MEGLTLRPFFWRATRLFPEKRLVSRTHEGRFTYTYGTFDDRVRSLVAALDELGIGRGDRVGTVAWNHHRHLESYFAVPLSGGQLHTVNVQLGDDDLAYVIADADDELLFVDPGDPLETALRLWDELPTQRLVVMDETVPERAADVDADVSAFEELIADHDPVADLPELETDQPAGMCHTSGTTGRPKGVEYTHGMYYAHALMVMTPAALGIEERDVIMPVVPMFHVNSWEFPYAATMAGATQVYPGPAPEPADLVSLIADEGVTLTAGVPTVWIDVLSHLDDRDGDGENPLESLERIVVGGSAAPTDLMARFEDEYGVAVEHAWGMTETMSIGSVSRPKSRMAEWDRERRYETRTTQGLLSPGLEMRIVDDGGEGQPWDGESAGELWVRGPTVVDEYHDRPRATAEDFEDGWLATGDVAVVDEDGYLEIVDRAKDVIKSGGEWISSIDLENVLMGHPDVVEAAVIAVSHDRWQERPLACAVLEAGSDADPGELYEFLRREGEFPDWWLPDDVRVLEELPKTATGKFDKLSLRERFDDPQLRWSPGSDDRTE